MKRVPWTSVDKATLTRLYPDTPTAQIAAVMGLTVSQVYAKAANLGLKKSEQYLASPHACRLRRGDKIGAAHRFQKGHETWNKGRKGISYEGMKATQFKKGQKPHTWAPIGSTRLTKEGYLQRKVTDTGRPPRDWQAVHVLLWVEHYGPIPPDYVVRFLDGDKTHIEIGNLVLLSRADLMRCNSYHNNYPKEIVQIIQLRGALMRQINKRASNEKQD